MYKKKSDRNEEELKEYRKILDDYNKRYWDKIGKHNYEIKQEKLKNRKITRRKFEKHGMHDTRVYHIWSNIKSRCLNSKSSSYSRYGGRGITICDDWLSFNNFWRDMGKAYNDNLTIDRIDNNGNYCKENCRWVTMAEQNRNKSGVNIIEYNGKKQCIYEWAREIGINPETLTSRINKYRIPIERAFTKEYLINYKKREH